MTSTTALLLLIGIALTMGVLGFALRMLREEWETETEKEQEASAVALSEPEADETSAETPVEEETATVPEIEESPESDQPEPETVNPHLRPVARLLRDLDGRLVVEVEDQTYSALDEVDDPNIKTRLTALLEDLARFLDVIPMPAAPSEEPVTETEIGEDELAAAIASQMEFEAASDSAGVLRLSRDEAVQRPLEKPSMSLVKQWRYLRKREQSPQIEVKTMLDEIDEILQVRIADTPWKARVLQVGSDQETGMALFYLDNVSYASVEEVPDSEAREIIRACIAEWERH